MKGGRVPIHIMRWAPADYVNDPAVRLALAKRDLAASAFYPLFLFHAFIQGGELPADVEILAAIVGMKASDVRKALAFWREHGKIHERDGKLFHSRVSREVAEELQFRELQSERGKLGGRPKKESGQKPPEKPPLSDMESPPCAVRRAPAPAPNASAVRLTPAPLPDPDRRPGNPLVAGRRVDLERECLALVARMAELTGEDPIDVIARASGYAGAATTKLNPATMSDDRLANTVRDLRVDVQAEEAKRKAVPRGA